VRRRGRALLPVRGRGARLCALLTGYSAGLRHVVILDALIIAAGFVLRGLAEVDWLGGGGRRALAAGALHGLIGEWTGAA
jgi:hypothetical protein